MAPNPSSFRVREFDHDDINFLLPDLMPVLIEAKVSFNAVYEAPDYQFVIHVRHIRVFDQLVATIRAAKTMHVETLEPEEITL